MTFKGLAFLLTLAVVGTTSPLFAQADLQARFDWSMPDRFSQGLRTFGGGPGAVRFCQDFKAKPLHEPNHRFGFPFQQGVYGRRRLILPRTPLP